MEKGENNINVTPIFGGETRNTDILIIIILDNGHSMDFKQDLKDLKVSLGVPTVFLRVPWELFLRVY